VINALPLLYNFYLNEVTRRRLNVLENISLPCYLSSTGS